MELELRGKETVTVDGIIMDGRSLISAETVEAVSDGAVTWDAEAGTVTIS